MTDYPRSTYVLTCDGVTLLTVEASTVPPFMLGEQVQLLDVVEQTALGWFIVETLTRTVPFQALKLREVRIASPGHEVIVGLTRKLSDEEVM